MNSRTYPQEISGWGDFSVARLGFGNAPLRHRKGSQETERDAEGPLAGSATDRATGKWLKRLGKQARSIGFFEAGRSGRFGRLKRVAELSSERIVAAAEVTKQQALHRKM